MFSGLTGGNGKRWGGGGGGKGERATLPRLSTEQACYNAPTFSGLRLPRFNIERK